MKFKIKIIGLTISILGCMFLALLGVLGHQREGDILDLIIGLLLSYSFLTLIIGGVGCCFLKNWAKNLLIITNIIIITLYVFYIMELFSSPWEGPFGLFDITLILIFFAPLFTAIFSVYFFTRRSIKENFIKRKIR